ncbi:hypothetical protein F4809DRAFT_637697 [Biscogniauxia mediterranea]|nr:hypothetical protein F4809DRAFT_637697 [Biscogniauxia mediterranea]
MSSGPAETRADGIGGENADGYRLGRGYAATTRLNLQHFLWKEAQGFLLHPRIQEHVLRTTRSSSDQGGKRELAVADLATGTGIWLFELLKSPELSRLGLSLHGFDISADLYPHRSWLPHNLEFSVSDLLLDPPPEFLGKFDVVHVRLILSVVGSGSPKPVINHIKKLLKPGGYIQWDELDPINHYDVLTPSAEIGAPHMEATFQRVKEKADWSWIAMLCEALKDEGFEEPIQMCYTPSPETMRAWTCNELCTAEELSWNWGGGREGELWREDIRKAYEETHGSVGAVLRIRPTVTVARKPS